MSTPFDMITITPAHADVLAAVHGEAFDEAWDADAFASILSQPGALGFIACAPGDGEPLGFALLRIALFDGGGGEAEVLTIATRPQARRQGVALAVMRAALADAQAQGVGQIFLEVAEDNRAARMLYAGLGFEEVGRRKDYYARKDGPRVDAIVMAHACE